MDSGFRSILAVHESEDDNADERAFYRLVLEEFSNGARILAEAQRQGMTLSAFKERGMSGFDLPFIPMRTAKKFSIKNTPCRNIRTFTLTIFTSLYMCIAGFAVRIYPAER